RHWPQAVACTLPGGSEDGPVAAAPVAAGGAPAPPGWAARHRWVAERLCRMKRPLLNPTGADGAAPSRALRTDGPFRMRRRAHPRACGARMQPLASSAKAFRVEETRDGFERLRDARAGAQELVGAVAVDAFVAHRGDGRKRFPERQHAGAVLRLLAA